MVRLRLILFFFIIVLINNYCAFGKSYDNTKSLAPFAINDIIKSYFAKTCSTIDVIYIGVQTRNIEDSVANLLNLKHDLISIRLKKCVDIKNCELKLESFSILIVDSPENFKLLSETIVWQTNPKKRYQHLVHIQGATIRDVQEIKDGFPIDNIDFLVNESKDLIDLVTSFMFTPKKCRINQPVTINRFSRGSMRWITPIFFPKKYENLHSCTLSVITGYSLKISLPFNIIKCFSEINNFKIKVRFNPETNILPDNEFDFYALSTYEGSNQHIIIGHPYEIYQVTLFVPPGLPYTPLEKMILPFDSETWIAIVLTLLFTFVVVQIINFTPPFIKNFCFGRNIRSPTMNFINILLTGLQNKVPGRNFSRFILMLFIIWCLIIRTCYQSGMFKYLQKDVRKPEIKSIVELIEKNFTFHCLFFEDDIAAIAHENGLKT